MNLQRLGTICLVLILVTSVLGIAFGHVRDVTDVEENITDENDITDENEDEDKIEDREDLTDPEDILSTEGEYIDSIDLQVRTSIEDGVNDTASGELDTFLNTVSHENISEEQEDYLETWESSGSYNNLFFNPAFDKETQDNYPDTELTMIGGGLPVIEVEGEWQFNPLADREIRFAQNFLMARTEYLTELYEEHGSERYFALGQEEPGYKEYYENIIEELEIDQDDDWERAWNMIQGRMQYWEEHEGIEDWTSETLENTGTEEDPVWEFGGEQIELISCNRIEDERLDIGHDWSDRMENMGFSVERVDDEGSVLFGRTLFADPADMTFHMYTGGWIASAANAFQEAAMNQMYLGWYGWTAGLGSPDHWQLSAVQCDDIEQKGRDLMDGRAPDMDTYWEYMQAIAEYGIKESGRVFLVTSHDYYVHNAESFESSARDKVVGWNNIFSPRTMQISDGQYDVAQYSDVGALYMDNWNRIDGSGDTYSMQQQDMARDYTMDTHPEKGVPIGVRTEYEYEEDYYWDGEDLVKEMDVPSGAVDYDVQNREWVEVGDGLESANAVTFDYHEHEDDHLGTFHDGNPMTYRDILGWYAFSKSLTYEVEDDDRYFYGPWGDVNIETFENIQGIEFHEVGGEVTSYTVYGDYAFPDEGTVADHYSTTTYKPWQVYEAARIMVDQHEDESHLWEDVDGAGENWSWSEDQNWIHFIDHDQGETFVEVMENMIEHDWIPEYLDTMPGELGNVDVETEVQRTIDFFDEYDHMFISQGPFRITDIDEANANMQFERWTKEEGYPFAPEYWDDLLSKEGYIDSIDLEVRTSIDDGVNDTASGELDSFLDTVPHENISEEQEGDLELWDSSTSYNNLIFNPAFDKETQDVYPDTELTMIGGGLPVIEVEGEWQFNPLADREIRFAQNFLMARTEYLTELYEEHGSERYFALGQEEPGYKEYYENIIEELEIDQDDDWERAWNMIQGRMQYWEEHEGIEDWTGETLENTGTEEDPVWEFGGEQIELISCNRIEDERLDIGHDWSDRMEDMGFSVERTDGDGGTLFPITLFADAADMTFHMYTGGWVENPADLYRETALNQMYLGWYGMTIGMGSPDHWQLREVQDPEIEQKGQDLFTGRAPDEDNYWQWMQDIAEYGIEESVRVFMVTQREYNIHNEERFEGAAQDRVAGWDNIFSPRTMQTSDGEYSAAVYNEDGVLYMDNWNRIDGSGCTYSRLQQDMARDNTMDTHPEEGVPIGMRTDYDVERDYEWVDGDLEKEIDVPLGAWDYDTETQQWYEVGEGLEAATSVTFDWHENDDGDLGTYHDGNELTYRDILAWYAFSKELTFDDGDGYYHGPWGNVNEDWFNDVHGIELHWDGGEVTSYTIYGDFTQATSDLVAEYYSLTSYKPWQVYEAARLLRDPGEDDHLLDGVPGADDSWDWSEGADNWINFIDPDQCSSFKAVMQNMIDHGWLPAYLDPDNGFPIEPEEDLETEVQRTIDFFDEYDHMFISQGPFRIINIDESNPIMEYERWTEDDGYPFSEEHWDEVLAPSLSTIDLEANPESDGWNFRSFNLIPEDTCLTSILEHEEHGISDNYEKAMYYDAEADEWQSYKPDRGEHFNNLDTWDHTMGIWIQMNDDDTLAVEGTEPTSTDITLNPGWNMVGIPAENSCNHGLPDEVEKIGYFDASEDNNLAYDYNPEQFIFEPGQGYQVYNGEDYTVNWTIDYPSAFVSKWNTEISGVSNYDQIQLPLEESGTYDFTVDWGDGTSDHITTWNQSEVTHTYDEPGVYTVSITGTIEGWRFNNGGDYRKIIEISQWGPLNFGNSGDYFRGCLNLELIAYDAPDLTGTTTLEDAFQGCTNLGSAGDMNEWDVSQITNMENMFREANSFDQDIGEWDVSNVTNMEYMFGMSSFNQDISGWDVSNVEDMTFLFRLCSSFNQDISDWDVSSVTNMYGMFYSATSFDQELGDWNVSNVSNMGNMLRDTALSTPNYDSLLLGWSQLDLQPGVDFHAGDAEYSSGEPADARQYIIDEFNWSITDGGEA